MEFADILEQTIVLLQHQGRISYGALKRRFGLDDAYLDDLKIELIEAQQLARDENGRWTGVVGTLDAATLEALARFFTLAETRLPGWEAGARSPVIALARELRRRGSMTPELGAWIKAHTDNRFLPYGSLLDRL